MCRERKYRANCQDRCINSYNPVVFRRCHNPENFPDCITNDPVIDDVPVRDRTCKSCAKPLLPAIMNYAAEVTAYASSAYREHAQDQVQVPTHIRRWFPRRAHSATTVESEGVQPEGAPVQPVESEDVQSEVSSTYIDESRESMQPPSHIQAPPLNSPAPSSSSQRTGIVYMENGYKYPFTVYDSTSQNPDWIEMVEGEHYIFENDPNLDEEAKEEFRPELELRKRVADWTDGIQKKTSSRRGQ